jgi:hypothetical protein
MDALPYGMKKGLRKVGGKTVFPIFPKVLGVFNCVLSCCRTSSAGSPLSYSSTVPMAGRGSILISIRQTTSFVCFWAGILKEVQGYKTVNTKI